MVATLLVSRRHKLPARDFDLLPTVTIHPDAAGAAVFDAFYREGRAVHPQNGLVVLTDALGTVFNVVANQ